MAGLKGIGKLLRTTGPYVGVNTDELRRVVGSQVRLTSPNQSEIFEVLRNRRGDLSLSSAERAGVALDVRGGSLFKGDRQLRLASEGTDMSPVGDIPYRGLPEGVDEEAAKRGLETFIEGPGVAYARGAYAGAEGYSQESMALADALRLSSDTAEPFYQTIYRAMGRYGNRDSASALMGIQSRDVFSLRKGEVFDMQPSSFTAAPESKSVHDYFNGANMIMELPSARGISVDHVLPGRSNQAEVVVAGKMRVKDITESGGQRRMQLEHATKRMAGSSTGARDLRHNLESTRDIYGMHNKF